jgi:Kef-type K+ transport system membrane component KefB/Trk K+ transport system NAD-binding subunit
MEHNSLLSLLIVVAIAFFLPILLHKLKWQSLPLVVAEIVAGLLIGKSGLNLVKEDTVLGLLSLLGFIFLMFLSGVEIDFSLFRRKTGGRRKDGGGRRLFHPLYVSVAMFLVILGFSFVLARALVIMELAGDPYLMTIMIATISLGVVVPVLKERRMLETELGQTLLLVSVIADFVTIVLLAVYISLQSGSTGSMLLLFLFFALVAATYAVVRRLSNNALFRSLGAGTVQIGTRAVFALILFFVVLSESLGAENILGAFLAGVIVSLVAPEKTFIRQLDSFGYGFFIPIFFVMVGVNLDLWSLFSDWRIAVLIPVLLLFILLSKMVPALLLRFWFGWRETFGSGFLIASTLSLVIAVATIAHELGLIDADMQGALVLVAVLSCLIFPVLFNRIFPARQEERKTRVAVVGANHVTLPVAQALGRHPGYEVRLYSTEQLADQGKDGVHGTSADRTPGDREDGAVVAGPASSAGRAGSWQAVRVGSLTQDVLEAGGTYDADTVVLGTMDDERNVMLARYAKRRGVGRIIVRIEDPALQEQVRGEGFTVFSTLFAATSLLRAAIENPGVVDFITDKPGALVEVRVDNPRWDGALLRNLPGLQNLLILRIYRGESFLIPHGNTEILLGDRLLVSGEEEAVDRLRHNLG